MNFMREEGVMKGDKIKYTSGYKYQLAEDYSIQTTITGYDIDIDFIKLTPAGMLTIKKGYAWDGASGPTIDTPSTFRGSLVHDALYQLMREDLIGQHNRIIADCYLRDICIEDGMWKWRANLWYNGVRKFAMSAANSENDREILTAP
jgi:hypothetical protein